MNNLATKAQFLMGRSHLLLKKNLPDILLYAGLAAMGAGVVMAAKAGREHNAVKQANDERAEHAARDIQWRGETNQITEQQAQQEAALVVLQNGIQWVKLYGPAILMATAGATSIVAGHMKTKERAAAVMAAYSVLDQSFKSYRSRVVDKYGEKIDADMLMGPPDKKTYVHVDEATGKDKKAKYDVYSCCSEYAMIFDEYNVNWRNEPHLNDFFLRSQQAMLNAKLNSQGHVFLNEVHDAIGMPRTKAGAVVGWVRNSENGDGVIDLGLNAPFNEGFLLGVESTCIIDPNVDGVIYDLL